MNYLQPYLDYFSAHPGWAITFVFLIAFGEALLIIGLFVPSTAVLVGAGILVGTGQLPFWPVFIAATVGAIAGDQISYWAGRLYGQRLKTFWPLSHYPQLVARGEEFVRGHGGKSIALGRFVPGVKAVVPGIVGMFGMGQIYFASINFASGIIWAAAHVLPGILIGQGLAFAGELSGRLVFVLLILLVSVGFAGYLIRVVVAALSPYLTHGLWRLSRWAGGRPGPFMRRLSRAISPENPRSLLVVVFAAVTFVGAIALINLIVDVVSEDAFSNADVSIFNLMKEMRNAPADELMITLTMLGDTLVMTVLSVTIIVWLMWRRAYRAAIAATIAIVAGKIFVPILKYGIQRARPIELYGGAEQFSFPSGHATMAALIFGILAVLVGHALGRWSRSLVYAMCTVLVVAIAYSRVYLGVHWLSDVLGGLLFGAVMAAAFGIAIEAVPPRRIRPVGLFATSLIAFVLAGAIHVSWSYEEAEDIYAPQPHIVTVSLAQWSSDGWKAIPKRRIDLVGKVGETFLIQYAGSYDALRLAAAERGWSETPKWTWRQSIPYLNPNATLAALPPRPALHEGLKAKITLIRPVSDVEREVLRIFKTDVMIANRDRRVPLYLVSLTRETLRRSLNLYAVPRSVVAKYDERKAVLFEFGKSRRLLVLAENEVNKLRQGLFLAVP
ncbi:MAG: phosphatase PAP2 family protein [Rhizobiales bacterium]|nr:phosphatase PAP2 family protein [Hyphomicrobiales bacterium]MBI3674939.1 phosphatase PAP2 family protein [Hyphomicrobiales bacterium]